MRLQVGDIEREGIGWRGWDKLVDKSWGWLLRGERIAGMSKRETDGWGSFGVVFLHQQRCCVMPRCVERENESSSSGVVGVGWWVASLPVIRTHESGRKRCQGDLGNPR